MLVLVHILLLVFWLGTDVGVFVSALWVKKRGRPLSERFLLLQLGALLDVMPRLCSALMFPVGAMLARARWGLHIDDAVLGALWSIALVWCFAIITAYRRHDTPVAALIGKIQNIGLALAGLALMGWGSTLLGGDGVPDWLAIKIILFGVIFFLSIGIDLTFRPVIQTLLAMAAPGGGSDAQESALRTSINRCCAVVLALYAAVVAMSALGVIQRPF
ncbi:MAG TPA: hypothetical protein VGE08_09080 [Steroidobacter sp.]|uniref:hypothetical protein n=1 Tax=Steroidobacter sp. TaxID=1978227 RepID=UPI002ED84B36